MRFVRENYIIALEVESMHFENIPMTRKFGGRAVSYLDSFR